jgi:hypothetical protein
MLHAAVAIGLSPPGRVCITRRPTPFSTHTHTHTHTYTHARMGHDDNNNNDDDDDDDDRRRSTPATRSSPTPCSTTPSPSPPSSRYVGPHRRSTSRQIDRCRPKPWLFGHVHTSTCMHSGSSSSLPLSPPHHHITRSRRSARSPSSSSWLPSRGLSLWAASRCAFLSAACHVVDAPCVIRPCDRPCTRAHRYLDLA